MTEGNRPTVRVDFRRVEAEPVLADQGLGGEGLIDLVAVNIRIGQVSRLEELFDGVVRTEAHHRRINPDQGGPRPLGQRGQPKFFHRAGRRQSHSRRPVINPRGVTSRDGPVRLKGRL